MVKKIAEILIICIFIAAMITASVFTILDRDKKTSYYENRSFATMPEFKKDALMNGSYFSQLESFLTDHAGGRKKMLELKTEADLDLFQRPMVNDVVVQDDLLLSYCEFDKLNPADLPERIAEITPNLQAVADSVKAYGGYYCYVAVPPQFYCYADRYPWYMDNWKDYADTEVALLSKSLAEAGVDVLDMGPIFKESGTLQKESSRVDDHYSIYGAFRTYKAIMRKLNQISGQDMDVLSDNDVVITKVPNAYLGAYERKLLGLKSINESLYRLDLVEPVEFTSTVNGIEQPYPAVYHSSAKKSKRVTYQYYMGGDLPVAIIDTHRPELPSILIYGDSFTDALECILYNSFDKMYTLDMRYYTDSTVSEFTKKYGPEYVICVRDYESLTSAEANGGR